jgi:hexaprenyl-diphosphate synthase
MLDFSTTAELGKPSGGADMKLGLTTAPALFAWQEEPKMGELIARRFSGHGDVELVSNAIPYSLQHTCLS